MRENGGVYTHGATWAVIAGAILGRGKSAHRMYSRLNPVNRGMKPDVYCAEPYVTAGNIEGPESSFYGRGGWTWYSGSAAWLFKAGLEWILGVRASIDGLIVDPCIPPAWDVYTVRRKFRGAGYVITVRNPAHVECGVRQVTVDGKVMPKTAGVRHALLPLFPPGTDHAVEIVLGKV
jgi:cellobiose phosphorylase